MSGNRVSSSVFALVVSFTAMLVIGCEGDSASPPGPTTPIGPATTTEGRGYVEPLVPRATVFLPATPGAKFADEKVPLPPVEDLVAQVANYIKKLDTDIEDISDTKNYTADNESLLRDANAFILIVLAIGLSEEDSSLKKAAPGLLEAAFAVIKATDFPGARAGVEGIKKALESSGDPSTLTWTKVAVLGPVMKAVPNISSSVATASNTPKKLKSAKGLAMTLQGTATLAAIMQGSIANYDESDKNGTREQWEKLCRDFRDMALKANAEVHLFADGKAEYSAASGALDAMKASCDDCHKVFHQDAIGK
ncbi:MAG TPA: hypothetical protein DEB39_02835 [Planctomycetaceae bacterium]|nr:hypothetical protein [Planctomycetaceae bacterium]